MLALVAYEHLGRGSGVAADNALGLPGQFVVGVVQEVAVGQGVPEPVAGGRFALGDFRKRRSLEVVDLLCRVERLVQAALQLLVGRNVQLVQQCFAPGRPQRRVGAAQVGDRQQEEAAQANPVSDQPRELAHHVRVADVAFLRRYRHLQVMFDQPVNHASVVGAQVVIQAELPGEHAADAGMVAVAPLADVMEQGRRRYSSSGLGNCRNSSR